MELFITSVLLVPVLIRCNILFLLHIHNTDTRKIPFEFSNQSDGSRKQALLYTQPSK